MKKLVVSGVAVAAVAVAFGGTFTYTWDGTSASYGENQVEVTYESESAKTLTVHVAEGDTVVFEGETLVSFAADATVKVDGRGCIVFSNEVAAAGAITFTSDAPRLVFDYPNSDYPSGTLEDLVAGGPEVLAFKV